MTLRHFDGFELGDAKLRYLSNINTLFDTTATRLSYGRALGLDGGQVVGISVPAAATIVTGFAINITDTGGYLTVYGDGNTTQHITISLDSGDFIRARRGTTSGTVLGISSIPTPEGWFYFEAKITIHDTTGAIVLKVNGNEVLNLSNIDTKNGGTNNSIDVVKLGSSVGNFVYVDDWYVCDTAGSVNNDFLGDIRVFTLAPNGNGNSSQLTGSDGNSTDNYLLVDEQPYNTADYVGSATPNQKDTYTLQDLPGTVASVIAVQEVAIASKADGGDATLKQVIRAGGTDYATSAFGVGTSWGALTNLRELNPNTGVAWTPANVNAAEVGVQIG